MDSVPRLHVEGLRSRGRPKKRWMDCVEENICVWKEWTARWQLIGENERRRRVVPPPHNVGKGRLFPKNEF